MNRPHPVASISQASQSRPQASRIWREMGALALEGVAVGFAFSVLLAAAVYLVAHRTDAALPSDSAGVATTRTTA